MVFPKTKTRPSLSRGERVIVDDIELVPFSELLHFYALVADKLIYLTAFLLPRVSSPQIRFVWLFQQTSFLLHAAQADYCIVTGPGFEPQRRKDPHQPPDFDDDHKILECAWQGTFSNYSTSGLLITHLQADRPFATRLSTVGIFQTTSLSHAAVFSGHQLSDNIHQVTRTPNCRQTRSQPQIYD